MKEDWKQAALFDFARWLENLPEEPVVTETPQAVDLHALVSAFAALRQEVRLQSRLQDRAVRGLEQAVEVCEVVGALTDVQKEQIKELETRVEQEAERRCVMPFLDVRDALVRGHEAALKGAEKRGVWRRPPMGAAGVVQGYEMAIERFDRALAHLGVARVPTVGYVFDAHMMTAIDVRMVAGVADEEVLEESRSGFVQNGKVLRMAEVVVNRVGTLERFNVSTF